MLKWLAKLWFCKVLNEHTTWNIHINKDKTVCLWCKRCGTKVQDKEALDEFLK